MTGPALDRLWPVLLGLVALIAGSLALEAVARRRSTEPVVIRIEAGQQAPVNDDEGGDEDGDGAVASAAPVNPLHAQARLAAQRAHYADAEALFGKAIAQLPDSAVLHAEAGAWRLSARDPRGALSHLERAEALAPGDARVSLQLGLAHSRLGELDAAVRFLKQALERRPSYGSARAALGSVLRKQGKHAEAVTVLEEAVKSGSNEERARALVSLGAAYLAVKRRDDADRCFTRAVEYAPAQAEVRLGIARALLASGKEEDRRRALELLARTAELAPDLPQVFAALGRAREKVGDVSGAEEAYERALRLEPAYHYARRRLLRLALDRRDFARARVEVDRLLGDGPEVPEHHFLAALAADREGQRDAARGHYADAIEKAKGNYPEAYLNLGVLEKKAGRLDAARAAYRKALELRPGYVTALSNLGSLEAAANDDAAADAAYRKAIAIDASYAPAWLNLGELLAHQDRHDEAIEAFRGALRARPAYDEAQLNLGVALTRAGRAAEALDTYRALVQRSPRYLSAQYNLALALADAGRPQDARAALERALALDSAHQPSLRKLAELDVAAGRFDDARREYEELLDLSPVDRGLELALAEVLERQGDTTACAQHVRALRAALPRDERVRALASKCLGDDAVLSP